MGINNLNNLLKKKAKSGIIETTLKDYSNKIIAIDTSIFLYKFVYNGNVINGFIKMILKLWSNGIIPVFVFDGKPTKAKDITIEKRQKERERKKNKIEDLKNANILLTEQCDIEHSNNLMIQIDENNKKIQKINKSNIRITSDIVKNVKKLFDLMGVVNLQAEGETDILCAEMITQDIVDCCMTEDMDFLTHNCKKVLKNFNYTTNSIIEYNLPNILNELDINIKQFIDMCILMGCDYTTKITSIGPMSAYKLIKKHEDIEVLMQNLSKKQIVQDDFDYMSARNMFYTKKNCDIKKVNLKPKKLKIRDLKEFLIINQQLKIDENMEKIIKTNKKLKKLTNNNKIEYFFKKKK